MEQVCPKPTLGRAVPGCAAPTRHTAPPRTPCAHTERTDPGGESGPPELVCVEGRPFANPRLPTFHMYHSPLHPWLRARPKVEAVVSILRPRSDCRGPACATRPHVTDSTVRAGDLTGRYIRVGWWVAGAGGGGVPGGVADGGDSGVTQPPGLHVQCPHLVGRHRDRCAGGARRRRRCQGGVVVSGARTSPERASRAGPRVLNIQRRSAHFHTYTRGEARLVLCVRKCPRAVSTSASTRIQGTSSNQHRVMRAVGKVRTASPQHI